MTKVVFSPFVKPESAPSKKSSPQYLRLASTSLGNSIDVETFELRQLSKKPGSRHVLQSAGSKAMADVAMYFMIAVIVAAVALMAQGFADPEGSYTKGLLPESLQRAASNLKPPGLVLQEAREAARHKIPDVPVVQTSDRLRDLLHIEQPHAEAGNAVVAVQKAVVVRHNPDTDGQLDIEVHEKHEDLAEKYTEAKRWEDLSHSEQSMWKEKLAEAGRWAVDEGETILKGIFFSQAREVVGHVAQGVIG
jgi:prolactin regulatory element-binding protein